MSKLPNGGIWIDCKQLVPHLIEIQNHLPNKYRILFGDRMIDEYVNMVVSFPMAYLQKDEILTYAADGVEYEVVLKGLKINRVDEFRGHFEAFKFLIQVIFEEHLLDNWSKEKIQHKHDVMTMFIAKIDKGLTQWRNTLGRQVSVSKRNMNSPD